MARQLATAAATGVAQRRHLILWGSVTHGVTWWCSDPQRYGVNYKYSVGIQLVLVVVIMSKSCRC